MLLSKVAFKSKRLLLWLAPLILFLGLFACKGGKGAETTKPVSGSLSLIAGVIDGPGQDDGVASEARFSSNRELHGVNLIGVASDLAGNLYMADSGNHTIRKIAPSGVVTTLAGIADKPGSADGIGTAAQFNGPSGLAIDKSENLYVAEMLSHTIRKITPSGVVSTLAGTAGKEGNTDGIGSAARFRRPEGIAIDSGGNLYVVDHGNHAIRKITPTGAVTTFAGISGKWEDVNGIGPAARFGAQRGIMIDLADNIYVFQEWGPIGITIDAADNIYVSEEWGPIRKILPTGAVSTFSSIEYYGPPDADGKKVKFTKLPTGITVDVMGNLYVVATNNQTICKIDPSGVVTTLAGADRKAGSEDGIGLAAQFHQPLGITVDSAGNLYVADMGNAAIRKITPAGVVTTYAGRVRRGGYADGVGAAARFGEPWGIAADLAGNFYVADSGNYVIRRITPDAMVSTLAGTPGIRGSADGRGADALFGGLGGIAADTVGNLYVADWGNHTIRKITPDGLVSTVAGKAGEKGKADGSGELARFYSPGGITVDGAGNIYVVDGANENIRKITPGGVVITIAGGAAGSGNQDGPGWKANFRHPSDITADTAGNLYVSDSSSNTIRKITQEGIVSTLAGGVFNKHGSVDGTGRAALFCNPQGLTIDGAGNLHVADNGNYTIRKITPAGEVTTVAGVAGRQGIITGRLPAGLDNPKGLTRIGPNTFAVTTGNAVLKLVIHQ
jgi:sugar lactone lactonase YvrE